MSDSTLGHGGHNSSRHSSSVLTSSPSLPFFPKPGHSVSHRHSQSHRIIPSDAIPRSSSTPPATSLVDSGNSNLDQVEIPSRSTSLRRKPVPPLLAPAHTTIPSSHPFARSASGSTSYDGTTTPLEGELFFQSPPPVRSGPRPPRRQTRTESPTQPTPPPLQSSLSAQSMLTSVPPLSAAMDQVTKSGLSASTREGSIKSTDMDRESSLRAREEQLRLKEEEMRHREAEFLLRRKEAELKAREDALSEREERLARLHEGIATPSLGHDHEGNTASPRLETPLGVPVIHPDTLNRSLPRLPDSSRSGLLRQSIDSPPPPTPGTPGPSSEKPRKDIKRIRSPLHISAPQPLIPQEDEDEQDFSVDRLPSKRKLWEAGTHFLKDEDGNLVCFGDLFPQYANPYGTDKDAVGQAEEYPPVVKTVVFFIRHFWCGQCQDYTFASLSLLDPVVIRKAGIRVVVISNGSWKIIKAYKRILNCPFPIYVDGPRRLYQILGMTKMTNDFGPMFSGRASYHQRPVPTQLLHGLGNAFFRFPLADPGKLTQLGGEFILTPGYNCQFAHRMTTTSDHMEAPDVMRIAGVAHPTSSELRSLEIAESQRQELARLEDEMRVWRETREAELDRIRRKKAERRGEAYNPGRGRTEMDEGLGERGDLDDSDFVGQDDGAGAGAGMEYGEYQVVGRPAHVAIEDGLEGRFHAVMELVADQRIREHERAARLGEARSGLQVEVEEEAGLRGVGGAADAGVGGR